jgi:hypothetical protein
LPKRTNLCEFNAAVGCVPVSRGVVLLVADEGRTLVKENAELLWHRCTPQALVAKRRQGDAAVKPRWQRLGWQAAIVGTVSEERRVEQRYAGLLDRF